MAETTSYIKLDRNILNWRWFSDPCTRDVFIYCLLKANWKDGNWRNVAYKRGQFITSLPTMSEELGFSVRNIRTALEHLKSTGELTDKTTNKFRIITVINYDKYQNNDRQTDKQPTGNRHSTDSQPTADKEYKEYKEYKNSSSKNKPTTEPPTKEEIKEFVKSHKLNVNVEKFIDYYSMTDWKRNGNIINWKNALRYWHKTEKAKTEEKPKTEASYDIDEFTRQALEKPLVYKRKEDGDDKR